MRATLNAMGKHGISTAAHSICDASAENLLIKRFKRRRRPLHRPRFIFANLLLCSAVYGTLEKSVWRCVAADAAYIYRSLYAMTGLRECVSLVHLYMLCCVVCSSSSSSSIQVCVCARVLYGVYGVYSVRGRSMRLRE